MKKGYVYIIASKKNGTIYVGVTSNLEMRIQQHKKGTYAGFSKKHTCKLLVWFEEYSTMEDAIIIEKKIKGWNRKKKLVLIEQMNPHRKDLFSG